MISCMFKRMNYPILLNLHFTLTSSRPKLPRSNLTSFIQSYIQSNHYTSSSASSASSASSSSDLEMGKENTPSFEPHPAVKPQEISTDDLFNRMMDACERILMV